jgi:hypothetical protein
MKSSIVKQGLEKVPSIKLQSLQIVNKEYLTRKDLMLIEEVDLPSGLIKL